jgi:hypothetical protein
MTTTRWLRISSVLSFLFAVGHTLGGRKDWSPMGDNPVLQAMRTVHFDVSGASRRYLDFYLGFGYTISVFQVMLAVLLWQLAAIARTNSIGTRPMIAVIAFAVGCCGAIAYIMILPLPALFSAVLFGSLAVSYVAASRADPNPFTSTNAVDT